MHASNGSTATTFLADLYALAAPDRIDNSRFFKGDEDGTSLGIRMSDIFALAKKHVEMAPEQVEVLLDNPYYEARMGAVSIMDFQARDKKTSAERKKVLFELYLRRHDRINNWDLVDRSAPYVVGGYLFDKDREPLYLLAHSSNQWERRTAIVATYFFIRQDQTEDTFRLAEILVNDPEELVNKAVGSWIREAGKRDPQRLLDFLERHAATMPRITLRYAIEKLEKLVRQVFLNKHK